MTYNNSILLTCGLFAVWIHSVKAQSGPSVEHFMSPAALAPYQPTRTEILERYRQAALLDSIARNTVFKMSVQPNWQADGKNFWYRNYLKDSTTEYIYVDAVNGKKRPAFDEDRLANVLSKASGKPIESRRMRITNLEFEGKNKVTFRLNDQYWQCDLSTYTCTPADRSAPEVDEQPGRRGNNSSGFSTYSRWALNYIKGDSISPDQKWIAFIKDFNVYVRPKNGGDEVRFTTDGSEEQPYGAIIWSPDSKYFIAYKINPKEQKEVYYVLSSAANTTRGQLKSQRYAQPGDEFTSYEMFVFHLNQKQPLKVNTEKHDFLGMPYPRWRKTDSRYFTYEKSRSGPSALPYY